MSITRCKVSRRGLIIAYVAVAVVALLGIVSLGVEYGRVQLAKTELRRAIDAAARAGASGLGNYTTATNLAVQYAAANTVDGAPLTIDTSPSSTEIEFGTWDDVTRTFTVLSGINRNYANAMRITVQRTINMYLSRAVGVSSCRISAQSIACQSAAIYGVVGLNYIKMGGNSSDSYWSSTGTFTAGNGGNIASNGDITLTGGSSIHGNARPGIGKTVIGASNVYGSVTPLTKVLSYANGSSGAYTAANNDNALLPSNIVNSGSGTMNIGAGNKTASIPAGNYYLQDFTTGPNANLTMLGPVTFFVYGTVDIKGQLNTSSSLPKNLTIVMIPNPTTGAAPGSASISSSSALYGTLYAPQSALSMSGSGGFYGSIVAKSVDMTGSSSIHFDASLNANGGIAIVK